MIFCVKNWVVFYFDNFRKYNNAYDIICTSYELCFSATDILRSKMTGSYILLWDQKYENYVKWKMNFISVEYFALTMRHGNKTKCSYAIIFRSCTGWFTMISNFPYIKKKKRKRKEIVFFSPFSPNCIYKVNANEVRLIWFLLIKNVESSKRFEIHSYT